MELIVIGFVAAAPNLVAGLIGLREAQDVDVQVSALELLVSVLLALGPTTVAVFVLWRDRLVRAGGFGKPAAGELLGFSLLSWVGALIASYAASIVVVVLRLLLTGDVDSAGPEVDASLGTIVVALVFSLTAGITEETVYRGYAITRMEQAGWPRAALGVPLLVWNLQHLYQGPFALPIVGAIGAVFVWLFWWRRSVWPLMVGHALYDLTVFAIAVAAQ